MQIQQVTSSPLASSAEQGSQVATTKNAKLESACKQFVSVFWGQVLSAMQETVPEDGILGDSLSSGVYQDMLNQQYSSLIAGQGSSANDLSEVMYEQLAGVSANGSKASEAGDKQVQNG